MTQGPSALAAIAEPPPDFARENILELLDREYGLQGRLSPLVSERDQNFRLETPDGKQFVVKIANAAEPLPITDFQVQALQRLADLECEVEVPRVLPAKNGSVLTTIGARESEHRLRVVSYVPGIPLEGGLPDRRLARNMGRSLALIDAALRDFTHPGESQVLLWDMQRAAELRPLVEHVPEELQPLVDDCIEVFMKQVMPVFSELRTQVIHNDLNPGNILVSHSDPHAVAGVIDFGDMLRAPLVVDVAIAASYLRATDDGLATLGAFVDGFDSELPLDDRERALLYDLVRTRLAATITILYWRATARSAEDPYLQKALEERASERFLRYLSHLGRDVFLEAVSAAKNS
ncbi:MAG: phosphotransferase [Woeseiaceae bacterium]|nr:phosphotransferase [Woeseiaceae bacterium]